MKHRVFIDGAEGTTGLKIHEYLRSRKDIDVICIEENMRKDMEKRIRMIEIADIAILCLPDNAAGEIARAVSRKNRLIDTSTAHRTLWDWTYGMPELCIEQRNAIKESNRVAVPGCHASGVIFLIKPLVDAGVIKKSCRLSITSLTGYSGGGKKMIEEYEGEPLPLSLRSPRQYGLMQNHKHLPEIMKMTGITNVPTFLPIVSGFYSGMEVMITLWGSSVNYRGVSATPLEAVIKTYNEYYRQEGLIKVMPVDDGKGFVAANTLCGSNQVALWAYGNPENIILTAVYDNLGKGASGAAVQNMNLMLGIDEMKGLI